MKYWDKETSKGNLLSVDLLDASHPARATLYAGGCLEEEEEEEEEEDDKR